MDSKQRPIFIVGLPRSGSTVWHNMLANRPGICRIAEMHFLNPWHRDFSKYYRENRASLVTDKSLRAFVDRILSEDGTGLTGWFWRKQMHRVRDQMRREGRELEALLFEHLKHSDRSLGAVFRALIEQITRGTGNERCCAKFPVYPTYIGRLLEWYPDCRIVHIVRDPRATAISKTNDPGGTGKITKRYPALKKFMRIRAFVSVALQYQLTSRVYRKYKDAEQYRLFRYEDLLVEPDSIAHELCAFVGVDYDPDMLGIKRAQTSSITGQASAGIDRSAGLRWRTQISWIEERLMLAALAGAMKRFDFDPTRHPLYVEMDSPRSAG